MEEKKAFKSLVLIAIILIVTAAIGAVFSSSILDCLKALATPLTALLITPFVTGKLEQQKRKDTEERNRQEALKDYLKQMTQLLVNKNLSQQPSRSAEVKAARALTLSVLRELDLERRRHLIDFLQEAELIQYKCSEDPPALLKGANLTELDLSEANLVNAHLSNADLSNAKLNGAYLNHADLTDADLSYVDLSNATLTKANLRNANLREAKLSRVWLNEADLSEAYLFEADLSGKVGAKLSKANLNKVTLTKANLTKARLSEANLDEADLNGTDLSGANLSKTSLKLTDLSGANLSQAYLIQTDLSQALLKGAKYSTNTSFPPDFDPEAAGMIKV